MDAVAWRRFMDRYGPLIHRWCTTWGLQEEDARDVTQEVLLKLVTKMRAFDYDPSGSFRGWLKSVAHNAWADFLKGWRRAGRGSGDGHIFEMLQTVEAGDDLVARLGKAFDIELVELAKSRIQLIVEPESWEVFRSVEFEGKPVAETARAHGKSIQAVYTIRSRVRKLLRDEVHKMEGSSP